MTGTVGDTDATGFERTRLVERNLQSSAAPWPKPIRIWLPDALFRNGRIALGNWKAGTHLQMFYPAWKYGRPVRVLALLGQIRPEEFRPASNVSRHARHRTHDGLRGF